MKEPQLANKRFSLDCHLLANKRHLLRNDPKVNENLTLEIKESMNQKHNTFELNGKLIKVNSKSKL